MSAPNGHDTLAGELGPWLWAEQQAAGLYCSDIVRSLSPRFVGCRGVCTSWDSGTLDPVLLGLTSWQVRGPHAVSPTIGSALTGAWPASSCGYDEWYFFHDLPEHLELHALCNWGASVGDAAELRDVPNAFNLLAQLERYQPHAVVGDGHRVFLITKDRALLDAFVAECRRRRTRS